MYTQSKSYIEDLGNYFKFWQLFIACVYRQTKVGVLSRLLYSKQICQYWVSKTVAGTVA